MEEGQKMRFVLTRRDLSPVAPPLSLRSLTPGIVGRFTIFIFWRYRVANLTVIFFDIVNLKSEVSAQCEQSNPSGINYFGEISFFRDL